MSPTKRRFNRSGRRPSTTEWLELLATEGPFLAAPVVKEVWPGGLPALNKELVVRLRDANTLLEASPGTRDAFVNYVLTDFLGWGKNLLGAGHVPPNLTTLVPEYHTEVRPDFVLVHSDADSKTRPLLLGMVLDPGTRATARPRVGSSTWVATPADRLAHALRANKVPLGMVTDGTEWTLVCAPPGGATTIVTWTRHAWADEPETLKAFAALLGRLRFFGVPDDQTLPALLAVSLDRQEEITTRLAEQSQAVVEMLVGCIGRLDAEHRAEHGQPLLPADVEPGDVYQASVTVLMRLVFLLYAEERGLLPLDDDTYAKAYAASTLVGQLREQASDAGEDTLERSSVGWHRLLATSRVVHRGARHDQLSLPGYGGSLFDPDRFPWLEGRATADASLEGAEPLRIDDRTLLRALEALQWLKFAKERRRVSFRVLDVEQIGYVYEGLLDQDARRADGWILGIAGDNTGEKDGPEIALNELQNRLTLGEEKFADWLSARTKQGSHTRTPASIKKALAADSSDSAWTGVLEACGGNEDVAHQVLPFAGLLRRDPRELPVIYPPGSLYLTDSELRAQTGAVYTPRFLAEQVVERALEPLVKSPGPLDTEDESAWKIRKPEEILALKVIDIAAGSGAFLVAATRFLADRLVEAQRVYGVVQEGVEIDDELAILEARRKILDHCIYGVDINPMAVEMAKLSLWLVTLDKTRPFGFLDDRLSVGDSLLGVTRPDQLLNLHFDAKEGLKVHNFKQSTAWTADVPGLLKQSAGLREQIADVELIDSHSADNKNRLLTESRAVTQRLTVLADALSGASLSGGSDSQYRSVATGFGLETSGRGNPVAWAEFTDKTRFALTDDRGEVRRPAHFPLLFPEVFADARSGFDAVVGNPPFLGGKKITGALGQKYREHLVKVVAYGARGNADLIAYFVLTVSRLLSAVGQAGLIATDSVTESQTLKVGLSQTLQAGFLLRAAQTSRPWPSQSASTDYVVLWFCPAAIAVRPLLDGRPVNGISDDLTPKNNDDGAPDELSESVGMAFIGMYPNGKGFLMSPEDGVKLIEDDPRNRQVLQQYLDAGDITDFPDRTPSHYVINFHNWSETKAKNYSHIYKTLRDGVYEYRQDRNRKRHRDIWWQFAESRPGLIKASKDLKRMIALPRTSKVGLPVWIPRDVIANDSVVVFCSDLDSTFAVLSSNFHWLWSVKYGGSRGGTRLVYNTTSCFNTFAMPTGNERGLGDVAAALARERDNYGIQENLGLTSIYNQVHDPDNSRHEVLRLRDIHVELDKEVAIAYGWEDLVLDHGHHPTALGLRWTVSPRTQIEILNRLLALNHIRHAEGQAISSGRKPGKAPSTVSGRVEDSYRSLFDNLEDE